MDTANKNRILFWLLIFLVIVNIAALATYFFVPAQQMKPGCRSNSATPDCILDAHLDLSGEQTVLVDSINARYQSASRPISMQIKDLRAAILDELEAENPDTAMINGITEEISALQRQLQRENIAHYLELKKVIDPDQALRLSNLYREMYGCPIQRQGGKQHQHRFGKGRDATR